MIDSTKMSSEYATNDFIQRMYYQYTESNKTERAIYKNQYRQMRTSFKNETLKELNDRLPIEKNYLFGLRSGSFVDFEKNLMIYEDDVEIDSKGTGKQVFIKTDFALEKSKENVDVVMIEEPENHLSPVNLRKLIKRVSDSEKCQMFISTHSSVISTRLEINNLVIMHIGNPKPLMLKEIDKDTAKYFSKTPPASIIDFVLSQKVILVEGPAEYMLMEKFYETVTGGNKPESENIQILDIRGLSFKRYLDVAKLTGSKVAVITDNDGNHQKKCVEKYKEYESEDNVGVFFDEDDKKNTFEILLYESNKELCEEMFGTEPVQWMTTNSNKTEVAYRLLLGTDQITVPDYIKRAIEWIRK